MFYIRREEFAAQLIKTDEGYVVLKGSTARNRVNQNYSWGKLRQTLLQSGALVEKDGHLEFMEDVVFSSPSAASGIVLGRNANGLMVWKESESNYSLKASMISFTDKE